MTPPKPTQLTAFAALRAAGRLFRIRRTSTSHTANIISTLRCCAADAAAGSVVGLLIVLPRRAAEIPRSTSRSCCLRHSALLAPAMANGKAWQHVGCQEMVGLVSQHEKGLFGAHFTVAIVNSCGVAMGLTVCVLVCMMDV